MVHESILFRYLNEADEVSTINKYQNNEILFLTETAVLFRKLVDVDP